MVGDRADILKGFVKRVLGAAFLIFVLYPLWLGWVWVCVNAWVRFIAGIASFFPGTFIAEGI